MRVSDDITTASSVERDRLARLEDRVRRIEAHLGWSGNVAAGIEATPPAALSPVFTETSTRDRDLEFEVGQHWFALAGVAILTAGVVFLLSLPYPNLPAAIPSLGGFAFAAILLVLGYAGRRTFSGGATHLLAAGMVLLGFSGLRLFIFGREPALNAEGFFGRVILLAIMAINVSIAFRRSPWLVVLALALACAIALAVGTTSLVLVTLGMGTAAVLARSWRDHPSALLPTGVLLVHATYLAWAAGAPFSNGAVHFIRDPAWAPAVLLGLMMAFGIGPLLRARRGGDAMINSTAVANCGLGYGAFLIHTAAAFPARLAAFHLVAAGALLGLAIISHVRTQSRVSTFFYAMTGYAALSLAILKLSQAPHVFVWLSVQSLIVVATAIGFRSRFIVVANFLIFAAIVSAYIATTRHETGMCIGFGLVALATARLLSWKQHRLELKTGFMCNTYLASAFVIFPYAGYHLVAAKHVGLVWIALAAAYYLLNVILQNQKYRWMGHGTLMLATIYVVGVGVSRFEPAYRVLSFLALGAALLTVSLLLARARGRHVPDETQDAK